MVFPKERDGEEMVDRQTVLRVEPGKNFVVTPCIENICQRCLAYIEAGYPVHFSGPAGTGKTTLALHLAGLLGRPAMLIYGDEEFGSSDLLGGNKGVITRRLVDNFIRSVLKTEESTRSVWVDERLAIACKNGYTLVYDEFSRSHAEANNVLLSVLGEGVITLPEGSRHGSYMRVHPDFRAILTSNPDEYAGVYTPQSALLDRMITIKLGHYDRETEIAVTQAKSGLPYDDAQKIVDIVRMVRKEFDAIKQPTIRACIMISQIFHHRQGEIRPDDSVLIETCLDVFGFDSDSEGKIRQILEAVIGT